MRDNRQADELRSISIDTRIQPLCRGLRADLFRSYPRIVHSQCGGEAAAISEKHREGLGDC